MLSELYIENAAVIKRQNVSFGPGLNVFTGETGAGKSIVIDSINALTGGKLAKDLIRTGEDSAVISGVFTDIGQANLTRLKELGFEPDEEGVLTVSRRVSREGRGVCRVNSRQVTVSTLREISAGLINIHGQADNQDLLRPEMNHVFLDKIAGNDDIRDRYAEAYDAVVSADRRIKKLSSDSAETARLRDVIEYQIAEIDSAQIKVGEYDSLKERCEVMKNSSRLASLLSEALSALSGDGDSDGASPLSALAAERISKASAFTSELDKHCERVRDAGYTLADEAEFLTDYVDGLDFSPEQLDEAQSRLALIERLKNKYGGTEEEILSFRDDQALRLAELDGGSEELDRLRAGRPELVRALVDAGRELTSSRLDAGRRFSVSIEKALAFLDMPGAVFRTKIEKKAYSHEGCDEIAFLFSANPGQEPAPLDRIASGGELARLMLAIKDVLAEKDDIDTLIFDEIDTGVSGRAAGKIAVKLASVAKNRQVICVTHLGQVAAAADTHLLIRKTVENDSTFTQVLELDRQGRIDEIARIIGGLHVTDTQRAAAAQLIDQYDD